MVIATVRRRVRQRLSQGGGGGGDGDGEIHYLISECALYWLW